MAEGNAAPHCCAHNPPAPPAPSTDAAPHPGAPGDASQPPSHRAPLFPTGAGAAAGGRLSSPCSRHARSSGGFCCQSREVGGCSAQQRAYGDGWSRVPPSAAAKGLRGPLCYRSPGREPCVAGGRQGHRAPHHRLRHQCRGETGTRGPPGQGWHAPSEPTDTSSLARSIFYTDKTGVTEGPRPTASLAQDHRPHRSAAAADKSRLQHGWRGGVTVWVPFATQRGRRKS